MPRPLVGLLTALVCVLGLVRLWSGLGAEALFEGERRAQERLADRLARQAVTHGSGPVYQSGVRRFDGQSQIAIDQMTLLGLGQVVLAHPELASRYLPAMRAAADRLVDPSTLRYAASVYGAHGLVHLGAGQGHAYLGYINMGLGMLRLVDPDNPHAALHDRLSRALSTHLAASPHGMIETYPGETWPPDVAAVAGSLGLHQRATGHDHHLGAWARRFAACAIDRSGYLVQRVRSGSCEPMDAPRGSGTAVAAYFVSFADADLSTRLFEAIVDHADRGVGGAAVPEYPPGHGGAGDVNAGPILFGYSVGATGFAIGAARAHG
ncbi:MAG: hypothetical protein RIF41_14100, partial [Polyangiaceae bacterium]